MKTKLVYVLTCAPDKHYIEQALMSVWSARHWNSDAHIVLMVDDLTDKLLVGKRAEILDYISEKIVVSFDNASLSMMYRSRFIKTSVRQRIEGDFLFIDCDTITCKSLADIDNFIVEVGAVLESHLLVKDYCDGLYKKTVEVTSKIGVDIDAEGSYFSSGVLYVRDTPQTRRFYEMWHQYWIDSQAVGVSFDQPSLAKTNRDCGHVIKCIPDTYNCILFTMNNFTEQAHILHVASYRNPCFLFTDRVFDLLEKNGLPEWIKEALQHPCYFMFPFDYSVRYSTLRKRLSWVKHISRTASAINRNLPGLIDDIPMQSSLRGKVMWMLHHGCYYMGASTWMLWKRRQVLRKRDLKDNICRK